MKRFTISMVCVTLVVLASAATLPGQTLKEWDSGGLDNNFNTAANWDDDTVPGAADVAQVNNGGTALITQDNTLQKLQLG
ncbi:MAG: hypothetical protein GX621_14635, partial [Pirellulaceae bacterium]|nr:hypothetical protein [Pirellulaceae bacterium]